MIHPVPTPENPSNSAPIQSVCFHSQCSGIVFPPFIFFLAPCFLLFQKSSIYISFFISLSTSPDFCQNYDFRLNRCLRFTFWNTKIERKKIVVERAHQDGGMWPGIWYSQPQAPVLIYFPYRNCLHPDFGGKVPGFCCFHFLRVYSVTEGGDFGR